MRHVAFSAEDSSGWRDWAAPLGAICAAWLCAIWLYFGHGAGQAGQQTALIYPPWWSSVQSLQAAAGAGVDILDIGPLPFVALVVPRTNGALSAARSHGALLVLNARFAALCGAVIGKTAT